MTVAMVIACSGILGFILAEVWHRRNVAKMYECHERNALVAEFVDKQLWQFISLDEWLEKELAKEPIDAKT